MNTSNRERFLCVLSNGPLIRSDAIAVFLGEDSEKRLAVAVELMASGGAPELYLSGGVEDPPRCRSARNMTPHMLGKGVSPSALYEDNDAMNTREQAVGLVAHALEHEWERIILVASPYHLYRAFLTVVRALQEQDATETIQVTPVAAAQTLWWEAPDGMDTHRVDLLHGEFQKCEEYADHVAGWTEGLAYIRYWEAEMSKPQEEEEPTDEA